MAAPSPAHAFPAAPARAWRLLPSACGVALIWLHALRYHPFLSDDALISLRYARRLLAGQGLTWTDGPAVEGYSNLLWVLACAALGALGLDLIAAARLLGYGAAAAAVLGVTRAIRRGGGGPGPALFAALALGLCGPLAVWAGGGLEQPLLAALLAWALALGPTPVPATADDPTQGTGAAEGAGAASRARAGSPAAVAALLALCCLTRPDGALVAAALVTGWALSCGPGHEHRAHFIRRWFLLPAAAIGLAVAGQTAFRLAYYGDWLPNPAYIKLGFTGQRLAEGAAYVGSGLLWLAGLALPAAAAVLLAPRRRLLPLALPLAVWLVYVAGIGGDIFPGRRHLAPALVFLALLAAGLWERARGRWRTWAPTAAALLLALGASQWLDPENRRALVERWEWDGKLVGEMLARAFGGEQPLLAVDPAGCLPYFSNLPAVDMLGLNDRAIARSAGRGRGWLGHEAGDGAAVLARQPDLILFCDPAGSARPCFRSGREMSRDEGFRRHYRLVTFQVRSPRPFRSRIWVRLDSSRIGIRSGQERVLIPGYLLAAQPGIDASLDEAGRLRAEIPAGTPASLGPLTLPAGSWRARSEPDWPGGMVLRPQGARSLPAVPRDAGSSLLTVAGPTPVVIHLGPTPASASVHRLVIERDSLAASTEMSPLHGPAHGQGVKLLRSAVEANPRVPSSPPTPSAVIR